MPLELTAPHIRVLSALQEGAPLLLHRRGDRGPYYTLQGRRLSVVLLKDLETLRLIERESGTERAVVAYALTSAGRSTLVMWQHLD
ncbi:hypothetical protein E7T06_07980 [Deinococcus sp. Arct2-2]|uniref:hypothetical protein n=1 Tax=Deinococcus sp. Arct2-2 TaxID=2568653 RepID=UPI0010A3BEB0|nr:hypothetical protein [Deinococcus sp. Arct2-2]THF70393.1 hypothetical protein E7T06_07980 [Deinococcus sp. Arct2-2]